MSRHCLLSIYFTTILLFCDINLPNWGFSGEIDIVAYTLDGEKQSGQLTECRDEKIRISTKSGDVQIDFDKLDKLEINSHSIKSPAVPAQLPVQIATLVDGSNVVCQSFEGRDDKWLCRSVSGTEFELPKGSIESLLLKQPTLDQKSEWDKALLEVRTGDEMVITRTGDMLDRASGIVVAVSPEEIEFSFDGQILNAPRSKLLGLLWYRSKEKRVEPAIQVHLKDGARWEANSTSLEMLIPTNSEEAKFRLQTPSGVSRQLKWDEVSSINFSAANVVWLASQKPLSKDAYQRAFVANTFPISNELLGPRFYASIRPEIGNTDSPADAKDQDLHFGGPGEIVFRIPEGFQRFVAKVRRFETVRYTTVVDCEVWVGDKLSWNMTMAPEVMEVPIDIPVVSGKQLKIVVRCDSDLRLGTHLFWQQPRLSR